jgi:hypothetical protein
MFFDYHSEVRVRKKEREKKRKKEINKHPFLSLEMMVYVIFLLVDR